MDDTRPFLTKKKKLINCSLSVTVFFMTKFHVWEMVTLTIICEGIQGCVVWCIIVLLFCCGVFCIEW